MLPSFCNQTVIRIRPGTIEERGSTIFDWSADKTDKAYVEGCSVQPASTSLSEDGRVLGISDLYTLFAPSEADIRTGDRIEFNGQVFEIAGEVRVQPSATGRLDHIQVTLRRYHG